MVKKAIIPVAGFGTRLLPITKAQPKEMLPVVNKPIVQYVVEDLVEAGVKNILFVTGKGKQAIENHFDINYELECKLKASGKNSLLKILKEIDNLGNIYYVRQKEPKGLGDAILYGENFVGNEYFIVMVGDTIYSENIVFDLLKAYKKYGCSVIALERVPKEEVYKYGVIEGEKIEDGIYKIKSMVEKPSVEEAPSNLIITGAYLFSPKIFEKIKETSPGKGGEIQITDAMNLLLKEEDIVGVEIKCKRYDIGDVLGWLKANVEIASEKIPEFREFLKEFVKNL
ncbi:UTP-glucose-1-phosphate uridylyltransferase [Methanocaldococcus villosus KIN24-T80]|uniref:UTP--glucose-1-phosphate uridylyltransferase n=1 Tax=Methanocaldococcus villosus KIN24-T80 TaxID=1069083 RepID=N6VQU4_9EURY|nr:UTP--glucose-1-phosphate uridylyltransferase GalU [Methanocaldococcus villosus]ENN96270.1 UTP-glucose-1-phosphate uridylyltransferase [Methanocaldococcus villosus KIN24-T80]